MVLIPEEKYKNLTAMRTKPATPEPSHSKEVALVENPVSRTPPPQPRLPDEIVITAVPKAYRNKAKSMLAHVAADPKSTIEWNERGELIIRGQIIPGSHISDLMRDAMHNYKNFSPQGAKQFYEALSDIGIPQGLIGNGDRRRIPAEVLPPPPSTPRPPRPPGIPANKPFKKTTWLKFY